MVNKDFHSALAVCANSGSIMTLLSDGKRLELKRLRLGPVFNIIFKDKEKTVW